MRAYEIRSFGANAWELTERDEPRPKAHEVVVHMRAVSLNFRDQLVAKGSYNPRLPLPMIPCSDGAGEVVAVGDAVTRFKIGDRVAASFFQTWIDGALTPEKARGALGGGIDGVLAELCAFDEQGLVHVPQHLSFEEAACLPCAGVTAWNALFGEGSLKAGEIVLAQGTGGVSIFALQFARMAGARVIITSSSDEKLERARALGANAQINYKETPDWDKRVRELTGGRGADHIVEVGGAGTLQKSMNAARAGGAISIIGVLAGGGGELSLFPVLMKNLRLQGIFVGSRALFEEMNRAIAANQLKPVVDRVFPFDDAPAALRYMESGAHFGKVVIAI